MNLFYGLLLMHLFFQPFSVWLGARPIQNIRKSIMSNVKRTLLQCIYFFSYSHERQKTVYNF